MSMKKLSVLLPLVLFALTLLEGCSSKIEGIALQVQLVKLERQTNGSFLASLLFSNPNVNGVNVVKSTHQVSLNGKPAGVLEVTEPIGIPAQQTVTTAATFTPSNGTTDLSGSVSYQLASLLTVSIYDNDIERYKTNSSGAVTVR